MQRKLSSLILSIKYGPHFQSTVDGDIKYLKANHFGDLYQPTKFLDSYIANTNIKATNFF